MSTSTRILQAISITLLSIPFSAQADSWSCRHDNNVREIHIERPSGEAVPCNVLYKKLTEGAEDQILWNAENNADYCEEKAKAFVEKQISWGWTCVETIAQEGQLSESATETETEAETETETATDSEAANKAPAETVAE